MDFGFRFNIETYVVCFIVFMGAFVYFGLALLPLCFSIEWKHTHKNGYVSIPVFFLLWPIFISPEIKICIHLSFHSFREKRNCSKKNSCFKCMLQMGFIVWLYWVMDNFYFLCFFSQLIQAKQFLIVFVLCSIVWVQNK